MAEIVVNGIYKFSYLNSKFWNLYQNKNFVYEGKTYTNFNGEDDSQLSFTGIGLSSEGGVFKGGFVNSVYISGEYVDAPFYEVFISGVSVSAKTVSILLNRSTKVSMIDLFKLFLSGDDEITLGMGADNINAFGGNDIVRGRSGDDVIGGGEGDDFLYGGVGWDTLSGGSGDDVLYGGIGSDKLTGGAGSDIFVFDTKASSRNIDTITDFSVKNDDIALDHLIFRALGKAGNLSSTAFHIGTKAADASDRVIYNKNDGSLYYDADGTGDIAAIKFAILGKGLALTAGHFDIL